MPLDGLAHGVHHRYLGQQPERITYHQISNRCARLGEQQVTKNEHANQLALIVDHPTVSYQRFFYDRPQNLERLIHRILGAQHRQGRIHETTHTVLGEVLVLTPLTGPVTICGFQDARTTSFGKLLKIPSTNAGFSVSSNCAMVASDSLASNADASCASCRTMTSLSEARYGS